jgi:hypothetical protein
VALELEGAVADDLVAVHDHDPLHPIGVELGGSPLHQLASGDIGSKVDPVLRREAAEECKGSLHIVRTHASDGDGLAILEGDCLLDRRHLMRLGGGCVH